MSRGAAWMAVLLQSDHEGVWCDERASWPAADIAYPRGTGAPRIGGRTVHDRDEVRDRVIELLQLIRSRAGSEEQEDEWVDELKSAVPHPNVTDLIFYPESDEPVTNEQIADRALACRPGSEEPHQSKWYFV